MFNLKYFRAIALVAALVAFTPNTAASATYTTIDYPDAMHTFALGNNAAGDIVGAYTDEEGDQHGFLLRNGVYTSFDFPEALWTNAYGINSRGDIVGQYGYFDGVNYIVRGFLLRAGNFHRIDITGHQNTMPFKISNNGSIAGCLHENTSNLGGTNIALMYGFTRSGRGVVSTTLARSMNLGINPDGDVVGYYFGTSAWQPSSRAEWSYLIRDGVMTLFQFPGAFATLATDISPNGTIIGRYRMSTPATLRGFILFEGEFASFDYPESSNTIPMGVNAKGDIVGYYTVGTGLAAVNHGFLRQK